MQEYVFLKIFSCNILKFEKNIMLFIKFVILIFKGKVKNYTC